MKNKVLSFIILLFLCTTVNGQTELKGNYSGSINENPDAFVKMHITKVDSLIIAGNGVFPDNQNFKLQGIIQNMNIEDEFNSYYRALIQIQLFNEYSNSYEPYTDYIELNIEVEYKVEEDESDGMPYATDEVESVTVNGIWHELEGPDADNIEFKLIKN